MQGVRAPAELDGEKQPPMPPPGIGGPGAVWTTTPTQALHQRAPHQRRHAQGADLFA